MHIRNLRHLMLAGASRLVLTIGEDGDEGGALGGGGADPAADAGGADAGAGDPAAGGEPAESAAANSGEPAAAGAEGDPEPEPAPRSTRVPWQNRRIDTLTATAKAAQERADRAEREAAENKRQLDAYRVMYGTDAVPPPGSAAAAGAAAEAAPATTTGPKTYTEAEFNEAVANRARLATIDQTLEGWYDAGLASGGEAFKAKMAQVGQAFGAELPRRVDLFDALTKLPNGAAVYDTLCGDLDHFADVLAMNPLQLGLELGKLSASAGTGKAAAPREKAISRAPAPITPIDGQGGAAGFDPDTASMEDYVATREAQRLARAQARGY